VREKVRASRSCRDGCGDVLVGRSAWGLRKLKVRGSSRGRGRAGGENSSHELYVGPGEKKRERNVTADAERGVYREVFESSSMWGGGGVERRHGLRRRCYEKIGTGIFIFGT